MIINHNIASLNTHRQLSFNNQSASKSLEKLSSGFRINRSGDDAAGLAISEKMRGQIRGLEQASRNAQDGISMIQTAEGAASTVHDMLQRARELAVQSANDTLTDNDRKSLNDEISQLKSQIDTVANNTEFNTIKMLNAGSISGISQTVIDQLKTLVPEWINDALVNIEANLGVDLGPIAQRPMTVRLYSNPSETRAAYMSTFDSAATSLELGINLSKLLDSNNQIVTGTSGGQMDTVIAHEIVHALQYTSLGVLSDSSLSVEETWFMEGMATTIQGGNSFLSALGTRSTASINLASWNSDYGSAYAAVMTLHEVTTGGLAAIIDRMQNNGDTLDQAIANTVQQPQNDMNLSTVPDFASFADFANWFNTSTDVDTFLDSAAQFTAGEGAILFAAGAASAADQDNTIVNGSGTAQQSALYTLSYNDAGLSQSQKFVFQIGANSNQSIEMSSFNLTSEALGIESMNVLDRTRANDAIELIDGAIQMVSSVRSNYGALQNRLEHTFNNLKNANENLTLAESRIRDADMAKEMMSFTKDNILTQAAQAMLAQANQQPQGVLQLLR